MMLSQVLSRRGIVAALFLSLLFLPELGCAWSGDRAETLYRRETYGDITEHEKTADAESQPASAPADRTADAPSATDSSPELPSELTLHRCFGIALRNADELRRRSEQLFRTEMKEREIISTMLPHVTAIGEFTRDSDEIPFGTTPQDRFELYFEARQTLFSGEFLPRRNMNEQAQKIDALELKKERNRLLFEVATAFYRILRLERDIRALEASLDSAREFVDVVNARREAGVASRDEILLARARRNDVESTLTNRRYDRRQARARLAELLDAQSLPDTLTDGYRVRWEALSVPTLIRRSKRKNPDARIARAEIEQARAAKNRTRTEYLPEVDATFTHNTNRKGAFTRFVDWTLLLRSEWDLFDGGGREARMARSYSRIREARLRRNEVHDRLRREIREATLAYQSIDQTLNLFRNRMENAREAREVVSGRYDAGDATNLDVLRAEETAEDAARNYQRARLARKLAALRIHFATGTLQNTEPAQRISKPTRHD